MLRVAWHGSMSARSRQTFSGEKVVLHLLQTEGATRQAWRRGRCGGEGELQAGAGAVKCHRHARPGSEVPEFLFFLAVMPGHRQAQAGMSGKTHRHGRQQAWQGYRPACSHAWPCPSCSIVPPPLAPPRSKGWLLLPCSMFPSSCPSPACLPVHLQVQRGGVRECGERTALP